MHDAYVFLIGLALGATAATLLAVLSLRLVLLRELRQAREGAQEGNLRAGRALHALASRYPHGHVDISEEEWASQEEAPIEMKLIELDEGGVRILAK